MSPRVLFVALGAVAAILAAAPPISGSRAAPGASRVVDKTFVCATEIRGGIHEVEVQAGSTAVIKGFGLIDVSTHWVPDFILAGVGNDVVDWNPRRCKTARVSVPLRPRGLVRIPPWGDTGTELDCETARQVLIRVRAVFRAPVTPRRVSWSSSGGFSVFLARGELLEGALAARTRTGKPLLYAFVDKRSQARLFAAPTCYPD